MLLNQFLGHLLLCVVTKNSRPLARSFSCEQKITNVIFVKEHVWVLDGQDSA